MIILDTTSKSLEVLLAGAPATTQPAFIASYVDVTTTTYTPKANDGVTNSATPVTAVAAPAASTQRQVKLLTIANIDTAAVTATVRLNNGGTTRTIAKVVLAVNSTLVYTDGEGFRVIDANGAIQGAIAAPPGSTTQVLFNDAGSYGADAGMTYDKAADILSLVGGYKERSRSVAMGEWTTPAFNAGDFTAGGAQTWTVGSGDVITYEYSLVGKKLTVAFVILTSTIGGTPNPDLRIAVPGGFSAAKRTLNPILVLDGGTFAAGFAQVLAGGTTISLTHIDAVTNWANQTDSAGVLGEITFEVN